VRLLLFFFSDSFYCFYFCPTELLLFNFSGHATRATICRTAACRTAPLFFRHATRVISTYFCHVQIFFCRLLLLLFFIHTVLLLFKFSCMQHHFCLTAVPLPAMAYLGRQEFFCHAAQAALVFFLPPFFIVFIFCLTELFDVSHLFQACHLRHRHRLSDCRQQSCCAG